jgi:hypothetical protein
LVVVSVAGARLCMHHNVVVCSIGDAERTVPFPLHHEGDPFDRPRPDYRRGRRGAATADCCFFAERRPSDACVMSQLAALHPEYRLI